MASSCLLARAVQGYYSSALATPMFSRCSGVSAVLVYDDGGDNVASTAGFWTSPVAALLPLTEAEHDGNDAGDGVYVDGHHQAQDDELTQAELDFPTQ